MVEASPFLPQPSTFLSAVPLDRPFEPPKVVLEDRWPAQQGGGPTVVCVRLDQAKPLGFAPKGVVGPFPSL